MIMMKQSQQQRRIQHYLKVRGLMGQQNSQRVRLKCLTVFMTKVNFPERDTTKRLPICAVLLIKLYYFYFLFQLKNVKLFCRG